MGGVEESRYDALGNGQIHRVHGTAPCRGCSLKSCGRQRFRPGHGVEIEYVGVAVRLSGAALATEDDELPLGWVIAHCRVHQRRRACPCGRDLEPLQSTTRNPTRRRKEAAVSGEKCSGERGPTWSGGTGPVVEIAACEGGGARERAASRKAAESIRVVVVVVVKLVVVVVVVAVVVDLLDGCPRRWRRRWFTVVVGLGLGLYLPTQIMDGCLRTNAAAAASGSNCPSILLRTVSAIASIAQQIS